MRKYYTSISNNYFISNLLMVILQTRQIEMDTVKFQCMLVEISHGILHSTNEISTKIFSSQALDTDKHFHLPSFSMK